MDSSHKTTPLKLSEAIRLGATLKPQGFGSYFSGGKSCALGAALDAVGRAEMEEDDIWPELLSHIDTVECPVCARLRDGHRIIPHLNDDHQWTREQIADWVEQIEKQIEKPELGIPEGETVGPGDSERNQIIGNYILYSLNNC